MTMPAQPPPAARTRKQAVTQKRLDASRAVAYREQWCLQAPSRPSPDFGKKATGRADPYPTRSRCRRTPPRRNPNHHENHAHQQRRNHANDAHPERRLTQCQRDAEGGEDQGGGVGDRGFQGGNGREVTGGVDHAVLGGEAHRRRGRGEYAQSGGGVPEP